MAPTSSGRADLYPSRITCQPRLTERLDPVVYPSDSVTQRLSASEVESYAQQGYLVVEHLFQPAEIATLNRELEQLVRSDDIRDRDETVIEPGDQAVRSIFRVHKLSRAFARLARDPRVLDVARQLLGSEVYIHQSRANLKPGLTGKEFYWHSDFETWHVEDGMPRMRALSVSVALTANFTFNGPLMLISGSHTSYVVCAGRTPENHYKQSLRKQEYGVPDPHFLKQLADQGGIAAPVGPAGSAVFFDCNTLHGSNSNISPYPRRNVFIVYNSVANILEEPFCGLEPRPEHIATRADFAPLLPLCA